jgi:hypothetical protein
MSDFRPLHLTGHIVPQMNLSAQLAANAFLGCHESDCRSIGPDQLERRCFISRFFDSEPVW